MAGASAGPDQPLSSLPGGSLRAAASGGPQEGLGLSICSELRPVAGALRAAATQWLSVFVSVRVRGRERVCACAALHGERAWPDFGPSTERLAGGQGGTCLPWAFCRETRSCP